MPKIVLKKSNKILEVSYGTRLFDVAKINSLPIVFGCGGDGRCGSCLIKIISGQENLTPAKENEIMKLRDIGKNKNEYRFACRCRIIGDITIDL